MRTYRRIECTIWRNHKLRDLGEDARWLYLYLLTCTHSNSIGLFYLPTGYVESDLGWSRNRIETVLDTLSKGFIERDPGHDLVLIKGWFDYNPIENPNVLKSVMKSLDELPDSFLKAAVIGQMEAMNKPFITPLLEPFRNRYAPAPEPFRNNEQQQEHEHEHKHKDTAAAARADPEINHAAIDDAVRRCCMEAGCRERTDGTDAILMVRWLKFYDLERLIIPTIQRKTAELRSTGEGPARSLRYFEGIIADAAKRQALEMEKTNVPATTQVQPRLSAEARRMDERDRAFLGQ